MRGAERGLNIGAAGIRVRDCETGERQAGVFVDALRTRHGHDRRQIDRVDGDGRGAGGAVR